MSLHEDDNGLAEFEERQMIDSQSRSAILKRLESLTSAEREAAIAESVRTSKRSVGSAKVLTRKRVAEIRDQTPESIRAEAKAKNARDHAAYAARMRRYELAQAKRMRQGRHSAKLTTYALRQRRANATRVAEGW